MFQDHLWFHAKEEFVWGPASDIVSPQVVGKLCYGEDFSPVRWLTGSPRMKILFQPSVHTFCLSIGAWVEGCGEVLLDS